MNTTKNGRSFFRLGMLSGRSVYVFSGLGEFRTHESARARWEDGTPRNGQPIVVEDIPQITNGTEWGFRQIVRTLSGERAL